MSRNTRAGFIAACVLACAALVACGPKKKECDALSPAMKDARGAFDQTKGDDLKKDGDIYEGAAKKLGAVELTVPELKKFRDDYKKILDDFATASRLAAEAPNDPAKAKQATELLDKLKDANEKDIYINMLKFCGD